MEQSPQWFHRLGDIFMNKYFFPLPKRPFSSYNDFVKMYNLVNANFDRRHEKQNRIVCGDCRGAGKHYRPEDYDPYEGYKLASKIFCEMCNGSGLQTIETSKQRYENAINKWKRDRANAIEIRNRQRSIYNSMLNGKTTAKDIDWFIEKAKER